MTTADQVSKVPFDRLVTIPEASAYLHVSETTIRRLIRRKELPFRRIGNQIRLSWQDLEAAARNSVLRTTLGSGPSAASPPKVVPAWARTVAGAWKTGLQPLLPAGDSPQVIVMDRRGGKTFDYLKPDGFTWGENLWHSTAIDSLTDNQVRELLGNAQVRIFDEMIQHGHSMARLKARLIRLDIDVDSICLISSKAHLQDRRDGGRAVRAVEDLDERDFTSRATLLSRLLARRSPPMDVEHVVVTGHMDTKRSTDDIVRVIADLGQSSVVWLAEDEDPESVDAFTFDRPGYFDCSQVRRPGGMDIAWDGPAKVRGYHDPKSGRIDLAFVTFPSVSGSASAWNALVRQTMIRYGATADDAEAAIVESTTDPDKRDDLYKLAYRELCLDASLELLKQTVEVGLFDRLGLSDAVPPSQNVMASIFGRHRGRDLVEDTRRALGSAVIARSSRRSEDAVPLLLDPGRPQVRFADPAKAREAVRRVIPRRYDKSDTEVKPLPYGGLMRQADQADQVDEWSLSVALDYELDAGTVQPTEIVTDDGRGGFVLRRAYWRGEYDGTRLLTNDDKVTKRSQAVCAAALSLWLRHRGIEDESARTVASLLVNVVHDCGDLDPLALGYFPCEYGVMPTTTSLAERQLLPALVESRSFAVQGGLGEARRYRVGDEAKDLFSKPLSTGAMKARIKGLLRAYAAIQRECTVSAGSTAAHERAVLTDPLGVLASARNEAVAFRCAEIELVRWIQVWERQFSLDLADEVESGWSQTSDHGRLQASATLFGHAAQLLSQKLDAYRGIADLRRQIADLADRELLEATYVILDSVDQEPAFRQDYEKSDYPVGLLAWAADITVLFTALCGQILAPAGIVVDMPQAPRPVSAGASYHLDLLAKQVSDLDRSSLAATIERAACGEKVDSAAVEALATTFGAIVRLLRTQFRAPKCGLALDQARQEREASLVDASRMLSASEQLRNGFVAVGVLYDRSGPAVMEPAADGSLADIGLGWQQPAGGSARDEQVVSVFSDAIVVADMDVARLVCNAELLRPATI